MPKLPYDIYSDGTSKLLNKNVAKCFDRRWIFTLTF